MGKGGKRLMFITGPQPWETTAFRDAPVPASFHHPTAGGNTVETVWHFAFPSCSLVPAEAPASALAWAFPLPNGRGPHTSR